MEGKVKIYNDSSQSNIGSLKESVLEIELVEDLDEIKNNEIPNNLEKIYIVDGKRKPEKFVKIYEKERKGRGLFACLGVGAMECYLDGKTRPKIYKTSLERYFFVSNATFNDEKVILTDYPFKGIELEYKVDIFDSYNDEIIDSDDFIKRLQTKMLDKEKEFSKSISTKFELDFLNKKFQLILHDGPFSQDISNRNILSYIKTANQTRKYSGKNADFSMENLAVGERSPIGFVKDDDGDVKKYVWHIKIAEVERGYAPDSSLLRMEIYATEDYYKYVKTIADFSSKLLQKYASKKYKDPRAPQNLTITRSLEQEIGRRFTNEKLLDRMINKYIDKHNQEDTHGQTKITTEL